MQASIRKVVSTAEGSVPKLGAHNLPCQSDCGQYALRRAPEIQSRASHVTIVECSNCLCSCSDAAQNRMHML